MSAKKKFKSSEPYLRDIVGYVRKIKKHVSQIKKEEFDEESVVYDAVSMMFLQIGESVTKLESAPEQIVSKFPDLVPWYDLKGLRNIMAHDYAKVDPEMLWGFMESDIDALEQGVLQILKQRFGIDTV
jgi:uncharacterized protein with HEPN domain